MLLTARPLSRPALVRVWLASRRVLRHTAPLLALVTLATPMLWSQTAKPTATLTGTVKDVSTGAPVPAVNVRVPGIGNQEITNDAGVYTITGLPMNQTVAVEAQRLGYGTTRLENIKLNAAKVTQDITINSNPLALEAVTSAGVSDATSGIRSPIAITKLDAELMPVPALLNSVYSIAGKVPGVEITRMSGAPQDSTIVQMRSISSPFENNAPLYVVDGVPLSDLQATTQDFSGLDIESIEIIRGVNAAALYGARASNGVILIQSKRAKDVPIGNSQLELRQDLGQESVVDVPKTRNLTPFLENASGQWVDASGNLVPKSQRVLQAIPFQDNTFSAHYDPVSQALNNNQSITSRISISQASQRTSLDVSFNRANDPGLLRYNKGARQNTLRFFLGHQLRDELSLDASVEHTRGSERDPATAFTTLFETEPDVNLLAPASPGDKARIPDFPFATFPDSSPSGASLLSGLPLNPIYYEWRQANFLKRQRTLVSTTMTYRPLQWFSVQGQVGYDRADQDVQRFIPPGLPDGLTSLTPGIIAYRKFSTDGIYGDLTGAFVKDMGRLTTNLTLKGHTEKQNNWIFSDTGTVLGNGFIDLADASQISVNSLKSLSGIVNGSADLSLDYGGKYIADGTVMREGDSRYGPSQTWNNYYRAAGAWLLNEESWFPNALKKLSLAKLRVSYGVAGNQPQFSEQYDGITITGTSPNQFFSRDSLGNPNLKPERKSEVEVGTDLIYNNKISVQLTYSHAMTKDAIIEGVAPATSGFANTFSNIGDTKGDTYEAAVEGTWINTKIHNTNFRWRSNFEASHSKSTLTNTGQPCSGIGTYHPTCDNTSMTSIWGYSALRSLSDLDKYAPSFTPFRDQWEVNNDGYLVPVGPGNHWWQGVSKNLWGTTVSFPVGTPAGSSTKVLAWGVPQWGPWQDTTDGQTTRNWHQIGDSQQKLSWGLGNRFTYGNITAYVHFRGAIGGDIWNAFGHDLLADGASPLADQLNKPDSLKKPIYYYSNPSSVSSLGGADPIEGLGVGLSATNTVAYDTDIYKNQSWVKLGELMLGYNMDSRSYPILHKMGAQRLGFQISGRDLLTFKGNYPGLDPEAYVPRGNGFFRYDSNRYPPTRNIAGSITVVF